MATVPAILGTARLGNFRLGYETAALATVRSTKVRILIAGVESRVRVSGLSIRNVINDTPDTCTFVIDSPAPTGGQTVRVSVNADDPVLLFNGTIQQDDVSYEGKPTQLVYPCRAIDDTARLTRRRPFGTWTNTSVTTIAQAIIASYAPGFTAVHVQAGLPTVSIIFDGTDDFAVCLKRLATAIGGYWYVADTDVHLFTTEATDTPDPIQVGYDFCDDPPIRATTDVSQLRTRQCGKGHGEKVPVDVAAGETIIPIDDQVMFNPLGGLAIAGTTPDGAQSQILTYTGVQAAAAGTLVGPGVTPSTAPALTIAAGAGLSLGVYQYAYTWVTAAGTTLVGPRQSVTTYGVTTIGPSTETPQVRQSSYGYFNPSRLTPGATYTYGYTFVTAYGETVLSPVSAGIIADATYGVDLLLTYAGLNQSVAHGIITGARFYRSVNGGTYRLFQSWSGGLPSPIYDLYLGDADIAGAATPPGVGTADIPAFCRVNIAGVGIGPSGTTSRKVYRTDVGGSSLKLQQTIANNTASVGVQDVTPDVSLGAAAPVADTAALTQAFGQFNAGSTSILTNGAGSFSASGGWFITSSGERIRYTGISGNSLTGIPASGIGSILTSVPYSSLVVPVPALTGVTGLTLAMQRGTPVHIWVQRDTLPAQATQAAIDAANGVVPADGIYEGPPIVDGRRGEDSLNALCDATLRLFSTPIVTVTYATRDTKTRAGKPIVVNLASPPISETLTVQDVTIDEIDIAPGLAPKFTATASTWQSSLEDLIRRMAASLDGV